MADLVAIGAIITSITGAGIGTAALMANRKHDEDSDLATSTKVALDGQNRLIATLQRELGRHVEKTGVQEKRIDELEQLYEQCEGHHREDVVRIRRLETELQVWIRGSQS